MRRALLTAKAATPITVGNSTDTSAGGSNGCVLWGNFNPSSGTGFLNAANVQSGAVTADYAIFTISPANVITAISATISTDLVAGTNAIPLPAPLAVNAGDYIGIWFASASALRRASATSFTGWFITDPIAKPSAGNMLTPDGPFGNIHWLLSATT